MGWERGELMSLDDNLLNAGVVRLPPMDDGEGKADS